jgi:hypothetical protein
VHVPQYYSPYLYKSSVKCRGYSDCSAENGARPRDEVPADVDPVVAELEEGSRAQALDEVGGERGLLVLEDEGLDHCSGC